MNGAELGNGDPASVGSDVAVAQAAHVDLHRGHVFGVSPGGAGECRRQGSVAAEKQVVNDVKGSIGFDPNTSPGP
jgi:hypothetical protein